MDSMGKGNKKKELGFFDNISVPAGEIWLLVMASSSWAMLLMFAGMKWLPGEESSEFKDIVTLILLLVFAIIFIVSLILIERKRLKAKVEQE